ncbi:helix-turn-helix domain-containing protein [Halobacillus yeomjeoni]|uniref:helix-turn-helix domain-containing protein n=1 Tax=Halobacillus yeomjeoni TaxID=311194 RepID=UPI001CD76226|nr:helix-turn-helix domain-containing protein [Halobacillus yeomjeoni]MCA0982987.1 helix-turn-helix domain-containing protein [Halobacillus yeomjeoni]
MFNWILLTCVHQLKGERTISGIFNLLTGKRSSQTMQDARGYRLDQFFGIYSHLGREQLEHRCVQLKQKDLIIVVNHAFPVLTEKGKEYLARYDGPEFKSFDGMKSHRMVEEFQRRVSLLIQTWTNIGRGNNGFIPLVDHPKTQRMVKQIYLSTKKDTSKWIHSIHNEVHTLLSKLSPVEAELFAYRLTGAEVIGMTREQLKEKFSLTVEDVDICLQHTYYHIFQEVKKNPGDYPALTLCVSGLDAQKLITDSAKRTYRYIEQGMTIETITRKRRLKESTIQDHIVEAALVLPQFSIDQFLSSEDQQTIVSTADRLKTQRLRHINQELEGRFSYFEIRLALAKHQMNVEKGNPYANA